MLPRFHTLIRGDFSSSPPRLNRSTSEKRKGTLETCLLCVLSVSWLISLTTAAVAIYLAVQIATSTWDIANMRTYFIEPAGALLAYSVLSFSADAFGMLALSYVRSSISQTSTIVSAKTMLFGYSIGAFCMALCEAAAVSFMFSALFGGSNSTLEQAFSLAFNGVFFVNALDGSSAINSSTFWTFVEHRCPSVLHRASCAKDFSFSVSACAADESTCYQQGWDGFACPYTLCKEPVAEYARTCLTGVLAALAALVLIRFTSAVLSTLLLRVLDKRAMEHRDYKDSFQPTPPSPRRRVGTFLDTPPPSRDSMDAAAEFRTAPSARNSFEQVPLTASYFENTFKPFAVRKSADADENGMTVEKLAVPAPAAMTAESPAQTNVEEIPRVLASFDEVPLTSHFFENTFKPFTVRKSAYDVEEGVTIKKHHREGDQFLF